MKKIKIEGKLNLDKMTVAKLDDAQTHAVAGGGFLSIGKKCTNNSSSCCPCDKTKGIFCKMN